VVLVKVWYMSWCCSAKRCHRSWRSTCNSPLRVTVLSGHDVLGVVLFTNITYCVQVTVLYGLLCYTSHGAVQSMYSTGQGVGQVMQCCRDHGIGQGMLWSFLIAVLVVGPWYHEGHGVSSG
jgi:hypothetical protein